MLWLPHSHPQLAPTQSGFLLPLRDTILFPSITLPVVAGRPHSVASADAAIDRSDKHIVIVATRPDWVERTQRRPEAEIKRLEDVYTVGTLAVIKRMIRLPLGPIQMVVEGIERVRLTHLQLDNEQGFCVEFQPFPTLPLTDADNAGFDENHIKVLTDTIKALWQEAASISIDFPDELLGVLIGNEDAVQLAYQSATLIQSGVAETQSILEANTVESLLRNVLGSLQTHVEEQRLRTRILGETKKEIDEKQREFFLREQLKKIQEELGEGDSSQEEITELRRSLAGAALPEPAEKQAKRELSRLERIGSSSAEGGVIRTYLDWLIEMPWGKTVEDNLDLHNARMVLDADHYGLEKAKDRIIEHLATFKLKRQARQQAATAEMAETEVAEVAEVAEMAEMAEMAETEIAETVSAEMNAERYAVGTVICFVGPPGVGKTSLGRSIARALGRPFERISLGGLRDEAELRGHRRTYIGAMPGRIIQSIHRAGVKNPVIMLDELDKVGMDYRGDPASVLLEILDPQQNYCFHDLYLDLDFDLSQVIFIGTANDLSKVPPPLLDRLELIELSSYSDHEKVAIAQTYLLPRQIEKAGLPAQSVQLTDEALQQVINDYTREAGVRKLEQQLGSLCRKVAVQFATGETTPTTIQPEQLATLLGPKRYVQDTQRQQPQTGVATGLAWTLSGGEVLFVEAILLPQGKDLTLTGQLGEVMEESARIARSYLWAHAEELGTDLALFKDNGLHLHVPAGAIPKDGPSAGVTMVTAIASRILDHPVRTDTAMTGEINLSGDVLPIGGVREKVLAAHRAGIRRVLLPTQNEKDLVEVPEHVRREMTFIGCDRIEQILHHALVQPSSLSSNDHLTHNGHHQSALLPVSTG
jgi:ATP-dependent Lon protease